LKRKIKSQRQLRIGEQIKHLVSELLILGDFNNSKIREVSITVTEVSLSPDLKNASIFVIPQNKDKNIVKFLNEESFIFKKAIANKLKLRYVPRIFFYFDPSFDYAQEIEKLLKDPKVAKDL
jgi:ribosome-binding factor A